MEDHLMDTLNSNELTQGLGIKKEKMLIFGMDTAQSSIIPQFGSTSNVPSGIY
jgi:hypothetical protein